MIASINLYFSTLMFKALKNKERYLVSPCTKTLSFLDETAVQLASFQNKV